MELVVKYTTYYPTSASYLDLYLKHDIIGTLKTKVYDKRFYRQLCLSRQ